MFCVQSKWFKVKRIDSYHALYLMPYCRDYSVSVGFSLAATSCAASAAAAGELSQNVQSPAKKIKTSIHHELTFKMFSAVAVASVHPKSQMTRMKTVRILGTLVGRRKQR